MKNLFKKWYFWVIAIVLIIGMIGTVGDDNDPSSEEIVTSTTTTLVTTENTSIATTQSENTDAIIKTLSNVTEMSFGKLPNASYEVKFDKNLEAYVVNITYLGVADSLSTCIIYNQMNEWDELVSSISNASRASTEMIQNTMGSKYTVIQNLYDVVDGKKTRFITCENGIVLFDMASAMGV